MGIHFWSVEVGFDEEKIVFAARKRFSGNTENVVGLEVLAKIVRRCFCAIWLFRIWLV